MEKWLYKSPIGDMMILSADEKLKGLWFNDQKYMGADYHLSRASTILTSFNQKVVMWLDAYFAKEKPNPKLIPVDFKVTPFREVVFAELMKTDYGEVRSYKDILMDINESRDTSVGSFQSVGGAIGHNPIAIIVPCHRIISSDGKLTGYAGGIERKRYLLRLEGIDVED